MLRYILYVWLAFVTSAFANQQYITVTGSGNTFQQAKESAFRKAIEFKVGVTVLSDLEVQNYRVAKEEIYLYSAGYVDDYKILSQENTSSGVVVMLSVSVAEGKLKNRILSQGKDSKDFAGDRHGAQISSYVQEQQQGDKLFLKILSEYPAKAFKVTQTIYTIEMDQQRRPVIRIPYELSWNFEYIVSLRETLDTINDCVPQWSSACNSKIVIMAKDPKDLVFGKTTSNFFGTVIRNNQLHDRLIYSSPVIIARLYDSRNVNFYSVCYTPRFVWGGNEAFYSIGNEHIKTIYGNTVEKGVIDLPTQLSIIDKTSKIELTVESKDSCKK